MPRSSPARSSSKSPEKHTLAQRKYYERQKERGLARKSVWVPEAAADEFWGAVDALNVRWRKQGLID